MKVLLNAVTATGASASYPVRSIIRHHTVQVVDDGAASAIVIELQGSLDDTTWFTLAEHTFSAAEITAESAMFHIVDKAVRFVRLNLTTFTSGVSLTAGYAGDYN